MKKLITILIILFPLVGLSYDFKTNCLFTEFRYKEKNIFVFIKSEFIKSVRLNEDVLYIHTTQSSDYHIYVAKPNDDAIKEYAAVTKMLRDCKFK